MTNSTLDYWDIDGTSLNDTHRWDIAEFGGTEAPPPLRGDGIELPWRAGRIFAARVPEPRTITFEMFVTSKNASGVDGGESQLMTNWQTLRSLFWGSPGRQLAVTKRWSGGTASATGSAVFSGGLEPSNYGMQVLRFSVSLIMLDPYFYGSVESFSWSGTVTLSTPLKGTAPSPRYTLVVPSGNSTLQVKKGSTVLSSLTGTSLPAALTVTFPDLTFTGSSNTHPGYVTCDGPWADINPEATSVVTSGAFSGTYYPAYL